ncbi:MAG: DUF1320 domain-containing protein [Alphaproteobacteria bacterium]|nr:MAG: DUF1320 domain-containing protein [Alphaproteobacteria bacterium]
MSIITRADLEQRFGADEVLRLVDRNGYGLDDTAAVTAAIEDAEAEVIARIGPAVSGSIPDPAPALLKQVASAVARYNLARRDVDRDHPIYIAYRDAVETMAQIASGDVELVDASGEAVASPALAAYAPSHVFTDDALEDMLPEERT